MTNINDKIRMLEAELAAANAEYDAACEAYDSYDLDPVHFKDADRSARQEVLYQARCEKAAKTREIGSHLDALKKERFANSRQGQMLTNLMVQLKK